MALRSVMLKSATGKGECAFGGIRRWTHAAAQPAPLETCFDFKSPPSILPENKNNDTVGFEFPNTPFIGGYMELMAVPKRKVTPHKRGIRNGPKALKPVPVIIRCKVCGRVKLPHFFCCSGIRPNPSE